MEFFDSGLFGGDRRQEHDVVGVVGVAAVDQHGAEPVGTRRGSVVDECAAEQFEKATSLALVARHVVQRHMPNHGPVGHCDSVLGGGGHDVPLLHG